MCHPKHSTWVGFEFQAGFIRSCASLKQSSASLEFRYKCACIWTPSPILNVQQLSGCSLKRILSICLSDTRTATRSTARSHIAANCTTCWRRWDIRSSPSIIEVRLLGVGGTVDRMSIVFWLFDNEFAETIVFISCIGHIGKVCNLKSACAKSWDLETPGMQLSLIFCW